MMRLQEMRGFLKRMARALSIIFLISFCISIQAQEVKNDEASAPDIKEENNNKKNQEITEKSSTKEDNDYLNLENYEVKIDSVKSFSTEDSVWKQIKAGEIAKNRPFCTGERLTFSIEYGPIKAGKATLEVKGYKTITQRKAYQLVSQAWTTPTFSYFYRVEDKIQSYMDFDSLYTLYFNKRIREGKYKKDVEVNFDQELHTAKYSDNKEVSIPKRVQDVLSSLYFVRTQNLEVGKSIFVPNHTDKKNYPLEIQVHKKEEIKTPAGKFECLLVEPKLLTSGLFEHTGRLLIWLTDDQKKMPVLMKSKVIIGSFSAVLIHYRFGKEK